MKAVLAIALIVLVSIISRQGGPMKSATNAMNNVVDMADAIHNCFEQKVAEREIIEKVEDQFNEIQRQIDNGDF